MVGLRLGVNELYFPADYVQPNVTDAKLAAVPD
jgi:hypothetical protein